MTRNRMRRAGRSKSSSQDSACKFLSRVFVLSILMAVGSVMNVMQAALPHAIWDMFVVGPLIVSILYLAWLVPQTINSVGVPSLLHRYDRFVYRHSGVLATLLGTILLVVAVAGIVLHDGTHPTILESRLVLQTIHLMTEVGVILAVACIWAPGVLKHVHPVMFWKAVSIPLLIAFGAYVTLLPISTLATMLSGD